MSLTCKVGDRISWRDVKIGDLYVIIGANDMVVLASVAVEFVLTLLLLLNILVSLMHTLQYLDKRLSGKSFRNLTNIAQYGIKSGTGIKSGSQRNRKRKPVILETVTSIQQNSPVKKLKIMRHNDSLVAVQQRNKGFVLVSSKYHPRVCSCGGCPY